jgi:hypothetical protein
MHVKLSCFITGPDRSLGVQEVEAPRISSNLHIKVARLSALRTGRLYSPREYPWYSFLLEAESIPGYHFKQVARKFETAQSYSGLHIMMQKAAHAVQLKRFQQNSE